MEKLFKPVTCRVTRWDSEAENRSVEYEFVSSLRHSLSGLKTYARQPKTYKFLRFSLILKKASK